MVLYMTSDRFSLVRKICFAWWISFASTKNIQQTCKKRNFQIALQYNRMRLVRVNWLFKWNEDNWWCSSLPRSYSFKWIKAFRAWEIISGLANFSWFSSNNWTDFLYCWLSFNDFIRAPTSTHVDDKRTKYEEHRSDNINFRFNLEKSFSSSSLDHHFEGEGEQRGDLAHSYPSTSTRRFVSELTAELSPTVQTLPPPSWWLKIYVL